MVRNIDTLYEETPYYEKFPYPLGLVINWTVDNSLKESIETKILKMDKNGVLRTESTENISKGEPDYDVEIYVVNNWQDLLYAPPSPQFTDLFPSIEKEAVEKGLAMKMKTLFRSDGRPKMFIFYAIERLTGDVAGCIASDSYSLITQNISSYLSKESDFDRCVKQ